MSDDLTGDKSESDKLIDDLTGDKSESDKLIDDLMGDKPESDKLIDDLMGDKPQTDGIESMVEGLLFDTLDAMACEQHKDRAVIDLSGQTDYADDVLDIDQLRKSVLEY